MREIEKSAGSVEEAVEAALEDLGASEQEVDVEILQEPKGGILGRLGSQDAVVRVKLRVGGTESEGPEDLDEQAEVASEFLEGLFDLMGLPADAEPNLVEGTMYVDVWGDGEEGMGLLIGRHGQTLEALQEVVRGSVQRQTESRCRVIVDVEDYRKRRRAQLASKARNIARRVKKTGRPESLEPMNPYERKIVHDAVGDVGGVESASEGEEPARRVVIRRRRSGREGPRSRETT